MTMAKQAHPLGLYLHIPFCRSKCAYCDFYSLSGREDRMDAYTAALERHLIEVAPQGNLALRQAATASCTCCHVWMRPKARRQASSVDWTPREMRLKPARRSVRRAFQSPALSGLASSVISAWGST